jgi:hypothetical protein
MVRRWMCSFVLALSDRHARATNERGRAGQRQRAAWQSLGKLPPSERLAVLEARRGARERWCCTAPPDSTALNSGIGEFNKRYPTSRWNS